MVKEREYRGEGSKWRLLRSFAVRHQPTSTLTSFELGISPGTVTTIITRRKKEEDERPRIYVPSLHVSDLPTLTFDQGWGEWLGKMNPDLLSYLSLGGRSVSDVVG